MIQRLFKITGGGSSSGCMKNYAYIDKPQDLIRWLLHGLMERPELSHVEFMADFGAREYSPEIRFVRDGDGWRVVLPELTHEEKLEYLPVYATNHRMESESDPHTVTVNGREVSA